LSKVCWTCGNLEVSGHAWATVLNSNRLKEINNNKTTGQTMFALFGLIALTIKIAILATVYASLTLLLLYIVSKSTTRKWLDRLISKKILTWFGTGFVYTVALFIYAFSYWGYSGLGDYSCIPIGNGFVVGSIDALESSWFEPDRVKYSRQADIINFAIKGNTVCGEFTGFNSSDCKNCFIVFDTKTEKIFEFHSPEEYSAFATKNNLPQHDQYKSFIENYREYWGGLKTIFLP
jgi:hypothetical protein